MLSEIQQLCSYNCGHRCTCGLTTAQMLAAASHCEFLARERSHPLFIPITAAPVCSFQHVKVNFTFRGVALPVLNQACKIILIATFAHSIHSVLGENVTACILDGLKTLTPYTNTRLCCCACLGSIPSHKNLHNYNVSC